MKILAVTPDKEFAGGSNRSFFMVISLLKKKYDVECEVLLPGKNGALENELKKIGVKCYVYPFKGVVSAYREDGKDFVRKVKVPICYYWEQFLGRYLANMLKHKEYDLVYTNSRLPIVGAVIAKQLKIPHICHIREFGAPKPMWGRWTYSDIYRMSDKVILISKALYQFVSQEVSTDKLVMIHNGIDSDLNIPTHNLFENGRFNMLLTGRLVPDKGHKDAIKAVELLVEKGYQNVHLYIAGSSPASGSLDWYAKEIMNLVKRLNIEKYVTFLGEVTNMKEIRQIMDVELMCALCETFGRVTVEGMRNGLLVVGSNTGGTVEIIQDGLTGYLYRQGDAEDLTNVLEKAYLNKENSQQIAMAGYYNAQNEFTPEKNVQCVYNVMLEAQRKVPIMYRSEEISW